MLLEQLRAVVGAYGASVLVREGDELVFLDIANTVGGSMESPRSDLRLPAAGRFWRQMEDREAVVIADVRDPEEEFARIYQQTLGNLAHAPAFASTSPGTGWRLRLRSSCWTTASTSSAMPLW